MTTTEIARAIDYARRHPDTATLTANDALVSLANLATERERQLGAWKEVMQRSPIGPAGRELTETTAALMRAEENLRRAISYEPSND